MAETETEPAQATEEDLRAYVAEVNRAVRGAAAAGFGVTQFELLSCKLAALIELVAGKDPTQPGRLAIEFLYNRKVMGIIEDKRAVAMAPKLIVPGRG